MFHKGFIISSDVLQMLKCVNMYCVAPQALWASYSSPRTIGYLDLNPWSHASFQTLPLPSSDQMDTQRLLQKVINYSNSSLL